MVESNQEKTTGEIVFNNEPKLSEHEVDKVFNERRLKLIPLVKDYISSNEIFKGKKVEVTFSHVGVSSLISIIKAGDEKFVLKIPLSLTYSRGEGTFLKVWEKGGAKVPHVLESGMIGEHEYTLMEYVDALPLNKKFTAEQLFENKIVLEMGKTLKTMHTPVAHGYGHVIDGLAEYKEFKDWFEGEDVQKRLKYCREHKFLGEDLEDILSKVFDTLDIKAKKDNRSSYCHDDYGAPNIFATEPVTVFDPNPRYNNAYLDFGRTLALMIAGADGKYVEGVDQFKKGYFGDESVDEMALQAAIFLNMCFKFPYWNKTKRVKGIKNIQDYILENKDKLRV